MVYVNPNKHTPYSIHNMQQNNQFTFNKILISYLKQHELFTSYVLLIKLIFRTFSNYLVLFKM